MAKRTAQKRIDSIPVASGGASSWSLSGAGGVPLKRRVDTEAPLIGGGELSRDLYLQIESSAVGKPYATVVVAPYNCQAESAQYADYFLDGLADDVELQLAIGDGHKSVLILDGDVRLCNTVSLPDDLAIYGLGKGATHITVDPSVIAAFTLFSSAEYPTLLSEQLMISNLTFDGGGEAGTLLLLNGLDDTIHDCTFQSSNTTYPLVSLPDVNNVIFSGCNFQSARVGVHALKAVNLRVTDCTFLSITVMGMSISRPLRSFVTNNTFRNCGIGLQVGVRSELPS